MKIQEGLCKEKNPVKYLFDFINNIIEEHQENTSRKYDRKYKPKRKTKRRIKRKDIKSDAQLKREKRYGQYFLYKYAGLTLKEIGEPEGKSKQAIFNFLKRNKHLEKVVTKEKS